MEELVDIDEVSEQSKTEPKWLFGFKEVEARKHRMVRAVEGKKKFHIHCQVYVKWVTEKQVRGKKHHAQLDR